VKASTLTWINYNVYKLSSGSDSLMLPPGVRYWRASTRQLTFRNSGITKLKLALQGLRLAGARFVHKSEFSDG